LTGGSQAGPIKTALMLKVVPTLALLLIRALDATWRYRETGREHFDSLLASDRPLVGAFLHGRTFVLLRFMSRPRNGRWISMCSKSLDGEAMAQIEERLGLEVVRGSSGRDGLQAAVDMIRRVRAENGLNPCLAVDGSRGPRGRVQGGIISLAQRTGGVIQPLTASGRPAHIFHRAWDRTLLPWPFARVEVVYGEPLEVPEKLRGEELRELAAELEERFAIIQDEADRRSGFADSEPLQAPTPDSPPPEQA
jgi:lysophospholipid acyltransferase (LPLAT)-like uncharacterized protein